jgi:tetratricopeptide (TPR) repeat protein
VTRATCCLALVLGLFALPAAGWAQGAVTDPEVLKGIAQLEEGEYDAAIFTLDTAARRLAAEPEKARDMSQAYLYLGIAYFGKGHEAAAKAKFREALTQFKDISLSAEQYPPAIINLFEAAREETRSTAPATPTATTAAAPEEKKGGGGKKILLIGGGALLVGGGVAAAAGGGDSGGDVPELNHQHNEGDLDVNEQCRDWTVNVTGSGTLEANLIWEDGPPNTELGVCYWDNPEWAGDGPCSNRLSDNTAQLRQSVSPGGKILEVCIWNSPCIETHAETGEQCGVHFALDFTYP